MWPGFLADGGPPDFVGIQAWPGEPQCLPRTRSTVREHQETRPDQLTGQRTPTDCRNCFRYALRYREEVVDALRQAATPADTAHAPLFNVTEAAQRTPAAAKRAIRVARTRPRASLPDQMALFDDQTPADVETIDRHEGSGHY